MVDDFNKKPPLNHQADVTQKKRIPVYILILVGIFFTRTTVLYVC